MARVTLKTASVVGTATPKVWSQVQIVHHAEKHVIVLVLLQYKGDSELIDLAPIGASLLTSIADRGQIEERDMAMPDEIAATMAAIELKNTILSITGVGQVKVYIERGAVQGRLYAGSSAISHIEGPVVEGDKILIVTQGMEKAIGIKAISDLLKRGRTAAEGVAVTVHGHNNSSSMACVIGEVRADSEEQVPAVSENKAKNLISNFLGRLAVAKPLYISEKKRNTNLLIGSILLGLLVIGIMVGVVRRSSLIKETTYLRLESSVTQKIEEAKSIGDLNPERAKSLVKQGKEDIETYLSTTSDDNYRTKADKLKSSITSAETEIFKKQQVTITTFVEIPILKPSLAVQALSLDPDGNLLLADTSFERIVGVSTKDKSVYEVGTSTVGRVKEIGYFAKKMYAIAPAGIAEITERESKIVIEPDDLWKEVTLLDTYAGNVYLLDRGQSEIWKYPALTDGFGTRKRWLAAGIQPDLSNVIDMKVDGDVWVLTSTGKLVRYSRGVPVTLSMEGFPAEEGTTFVDPQAFYIANGEVFVLEKGAQRVVVFETETGKYKRQYVADVLGEAGDLVVYEGRGYVLVGDKILWFGL